MKESSLEDMSRRDLWIEFSSVLTGRDMLLSRFNSRVETCFWREVSSFHTSVSSRQTLLMQGGHMKGI